MKLETGTPDPRERRLVLPTRVVWSTPGALSPDSLLNDDDRTACVLRPASGIGTASVLLDFGRELHGGIRLDTTGRSTTNRAARARIRFGESVSEAMGAPNQDHAIHDHEILLPWWGTAEIGNTGFRFVRMDLLDAEAEVHLSRARAVFLHRPLDYLGSFECSDARLNDIWRTGAYTVHLCMQDHVWDGVKRDRLVWIGDLHPEAMVIATVFGAHPIVPASLDNARDRTPLPGWMNGISSYSLWWLLIQRDWFRYSGDRAYLEEQRGYLQGLLDLLREHVDVDGRERLDGMRFLEWPTSRDPTAIDAGLQALVVLALRAGAELCDALEEPEAAVRAESTAARASACRRAPSPSKQANALLALAGMADPQETNRRILAMDPYRGLSTFYGYYILQARARASDHAGALDLIRNYWGGMLDAGATTFWEGFELDWLADAGRIDEPTPAGKKDLHADFGDYCYPGLRHSLCHGWAAGPTAWLTENVLGLSPTAPGFARLRVAPNLAGLDWARGTLPTPHGVVEVSHTRCPDGGVETTLRLPDGVTAENAP